MMKRGYVFSFLIFHIFDVGHSFYMRQSLRKMSKFMPSIKMEVEETYWITPDGLNLEVMSSKAKPPKIDEDPSSQSWYSKSYSQIIDLVYRKTVIPKPPILFIHGSFHSAWCWTEHFFDVRIKKIYKLSKFIAHFSFDYSFLMILGTIVTLLACEERTKLEC